MNRQLIEEILMTNKHIKKMFFLTSNQENEK